MRNTLKIEATVIAGPSLFRELDGHPEIGQLTSLWQLG